MPEAPAQGPLHCTAHGMPRGLWLMPWRRLPRLFSFLPLTAPPHAPPPACAAAQLEAHQARAPRPLKEEELGTLLPRLRAAAQQERMPPPPPKPRPAASQPAGTGSGSGSGQDGAPSTAGDGSPYTAGLGGKVRPLASYQLVTRGRQAAARPPSPNPSRSSGAAAGSHGQLAEAGAQPMEIDPSSSGVLIEPPVTSLPRLGCACCGLSEHATDQCPLAMVSALRGSAVQGPRLLS